MDEAPLRGIDILLVEDHQDTREVLAEILKLHGARVEQAPDPLVALRALRAQGFHAVVTDLAMPGATGFWLLEQIRKNDEWREMPVIAVSGNHMESSATAAGFDAYIRKPADPFALCETLASLIPPSS